MKKIVLVEDNADNRLLVQVLLSDLYDVSAYENGLDALAALSLRSPDLVLLDISLPDVDGREVLRRLRELPGSRDLPVVALTAHAMAGDREAYLRAGFDDYVTKPIVDEMVLIGTIQKLLQQ